ncbi:hypothetical protein EVU96_08720 [Bacillus infantis]|uniref:hypothetical protein n=1 Tax=Bacillus infantis TaxID=324767 RepID=UPI00101CA93C|nr:hypothetical protein [Bacillus infantis]RYI30486.1 hypothetical protein EVU96_08720 [Bacillus infantis]
MKKQYVYTGVVTALLASNLVTGYQFKKEVDGLDQQVNQSTKVNVLLKDEVFEKNSLIEKQQGEINTYEEQEIKLNNLIKESEQKAIKLQKELAEAKKRSKEKP